jgi:pimeloyl-ACP methyl ester carboxylesterase
MNALTKLDKNIEKDSPLDEARKRTKRVDNVYAEAIDQPGCGNNCDLKPLTYEGMLDFYAEYLRDLRRRAPGKPVIAVGFCYSAGFLMEVNRRNPGLIDGLVLTGLVVPDAKIGFDFAAGVESRKYKDGSLIENPAVHTLADKAYFQLPWSQDEKPTDNTPTLLLIGKKDPFQSPEAITWFSDWSKRSPNSVVFRHLENAGHGVLGPVEGFPESFISVLVDMNDLISRTVNKSPK